MKKLSIFLFLLSALTANANIILSDSCKVSLLTCGAGSEIYARFGHSAIRVQDSVNELDIVYNYGIFDFESNWFIPRFIHGATDYQLAVMPFDSFLGAYIARKSSVYEQALNLSQSEKQALFEALEINYLPKNRIYRYNFVYDNCATRPFIMIMKVLENEPIIAYSHHVTTYRQIINEFVGLNNWQRFGIDILIGREADLPIFSPALHAFPKYTALIMGSVELKNDSISQPLVAETRALYESQSILPSEKSIFNPSIVCCIILLIITALSYWMQKKRKDLTWLDFLLFLINGIVGIIIFYLMFVSQHPLVHQNYNLLWLNPLHFVFAFLILKKKWCPALRYYAVLNIFFTIGAIIVLILRYQIMHPAFLPLMAVMIVRSALFFQNNPRRYII
ncbi:MAG: DUF4105 domain-containing protein [Prevotellaceae bacterium]|jgi:hypothetical protein|nr:DUF4105 domain-containing protein [Prevotellaceae bacterium]